MKKNIFLLTTISGMFLLASCGGGTETVEETASTEESAEEVTYTLDAANSSIIWTGTAVGVYSHTGTINFTEGSITIVGDQVTGGGFTVDMSSITPTVDATFNEENKPENLVGHLGSPDFFDLANNPTASLTINSVDGTTASATLTIRGKEAEVSITDIASTSNEGGVSVTGNLTFSREEYGATWAYPSEAEMVLSDDVELNISISATK